MTNKISQINPNLMYKSHEEYCKLYDPEYNLKYSNVLNKIDRVYAIGDVHGDFNFLITALLKINVITIDESVFNTSNINRYQLSTDAIFDNTLVIQVGDQIDGYREIKTTNNNRIHLNGVFVPKDELIIKLMDKLGSDAYNQQRNFHVLSLFGNHELLNISGDFRYAFNPESDRETIIKRKNMLTKIFHNLLCNRNTIVLVNDKTIFAHAGIINNSIRYINFLMSKIDSEYKINVDDPNINTSDIIIKYNYFCKMILYYIIKNIEKYDFENIINEIYQNIFALRNYDYNSDEECDSFRQLFQILHIDNMCIGHNPQEDGSIKIRNCEFGFNSKKIINIDTARSKMWYALKYKVPSMIKIEFDKHYKVASFEKIYVNYNEVEHAMINPNFINDMYVSKDTIKEMMQS
jgi:hypothetical protein